MASSGKSAGSDRRGQWGDFPLTILHFAAPPGLSLDLRRAVAVQERAAMRAAHLEHTFGIVTAQDPMGVKQSGVRNTELADMLERAAASLGGPWVRVDACNPDHSHCERSIAISIGLQPLIALACRYDQLAIFWFDGAAFWIIPARSDEPALRLPQQP